MIKFIWTTVLVVLVTAGAATAQKKYTDKKFSDYNVEVTRAARPKLQVPPDIDEGHQEELQDAYKGPVNFAGHYILSRWRPARMGTSRYDVIDVLTGKVYRPYEISKVTSGSNCIHDLDDELKYKANSRLVILGGTKVEDNDKDPLPCGTYFYEWTGAELKLVMSLPYGPGVGPGNTKVAFERFEGNYFAKKSGKKGWSETEFVFTSMKEFEKVFAPAAVMGGNKFLPENTFDKHVVLATIRYNSPLQKYSDISVTAAADTIIFSYVSKPEAAGNATYNSYLLVVAERGKYRKVRFIENGDWANEIALAPARP